MKGSIRQRTPGSYELTIDIEPHRDGVRQARRRVITETNHTSAGPASPMVHAGVRTP